jgi:hypothetical protein
VLKTIKPLVGKGVGGLRVNATVGSLKVLNTRTLSAFTSLTMSACMDLILPHIILSTFPKLYIHEDGKMVTNRSIHYSGRYYLFYRYIPNKDKIYSPGTPDRIFK